MKHGGKLPCELIIWYVLPDLRNEISRILLNDYNYKQVEIAKILGVTKAAVNQYLSSKRGENFFNLIKDKKAKNFLMKELRKSTATIVNDQSTISLELCRLCSVIRRNRIILRVYERFAEGPLPDCMMEGWAPSKTSDSINIKGKKVKCPKCSKFIQRDWIACPHCGDKIAQLCPGCKKKVELSWKVCPYCARKLTKTGSKSSVKKKK